jgi:hypothetical protein
MPTYLITGNVFRNILGYNEEPLKISNLMQGQFGISKTYSFILYAQLSDMIVKYLMKYPSTQIP